MRDNLIRILKGFRTPICDRLYAKLPDVEKLADYMIENGVIVPPCAASYMPETLSDILDIVSERVRDLCHSYTDEGRCDVDVVDVHADIQKILKEIKNGKV